MTQAKLRFSTFEEYLSYEEGTDQRYELVNGVLVELPPESEPNSWLALFLCYELATVVNRRFIRPYNCEIQVPVLEPNDPQNRFPDLTVLREEHLSLTQKRLTIRLEMPPPQLVVEVVSPGKQNRERDFVRKPAQYAARCIPEYWLINPENQSVTVLMLEAGELVEVGVFRGETLIASPSFPTFQLTPTVLFSSLLG